MVAEVVELLRGRGVVVDMTLGAGGHAAALLDAGVHDVVGVDRDPEALALAAQRLARFGDRVRVVQRRSPRSKSTPPAAPPTSSSSTSEKRRPHDAHTIPESGEPLARDRERLRIAIHAHDVGDPGVEERLGVTAGAERHVHDDLGPRSSSTTSSTITGRWAASVTRCARRTVRTRSTRPA